MKQNNIILGQIYDLDLGGSGLIRVKPKEMLDDNRVLCEYLNSYTGRVEILSIDLFKINGYDK